MKNYLLAISILSVISLQSCILDPCNSKSNFLEHLNKTVENVKENGESYTDADWDKKDEELEKLMDECYEKFKKDLTREEKKQVFKHSTRYVYEREKDKLDVFYDVLEDIDFESEAKRFIDLADREITNIFNDVLKEDLETFMDDAVNEIERLAKDLKEAWEEAREDN